MSYKPILQNVKFYLLQLLKKTYQIKSNGQSYYGETNTVLQKKTHKTIQSPFVIRLDASAFIMLFQSFNWLFL